MEGWAESFGDHLGRAFGREMKLARHPEVVLVKPAERVSYAAILKDLRKHFKPDILGVSVHGIRETCSKDLLVEIKCSKKGRGQF